MARRMVSWLVALLLVLGPVGLPSGSDFGLVGPGDICSLDQGHAGGPAADQPGHGCCLGLCLQAALALPGAAVPPLPPTQGRLAVRAPAGTRLAPFTALAAHQPRAPPAVLA